MNKKNIKVVHIVEGFIGGLATYMYHVLPKLSQKGFDVTLICSLHRKERGMAEKLKTISDAGVTIRYLPMGRGITPLADIYSFIMLWRLLKKGRYDIIHTHCSKAGVLGRLAALLAGITIRLHSAHCFAYLRSGNIFLRRLYYWIERLLGMLTTRYLAVSSSEVSNASKSKIFSESKIVLVENGVPVQKAVLESNAAEVLKVDPGIQNGTPIIITGCRFIGYKGLKLLLETARYVQSDCHFVIAGEGQLTGQLKRYVVRHCLQDKVSILTPTVTMDGLLRVSDMAILCSKIEAQPYFLLEAMMARCPIIATDVPGNQELLGASRGLLIQPDARVIAGAIDTVLPDKLLREHFANSAYCYAFKNHSLEKQVERLSNTYLSEISHHTPNDFEIDTDVRQIPEKKAV